MKKSFSQCLMNVRDDLTQIKQIRNYLDSNADSQYQKDYSLNWQTIEAYNKILGTCSLGSPPKIDFLNTLLDSFEFVSNNKEENGTWSNFGFELGVLCLKILSAIEHSEMFQYFFTKLLRVMNSFSQNTSDVWKAASRQILNVIINKKFSIDYLETILTLYISILKNIDYILLQDFACHNLNILKTISKLIEKAGDFEIQKNIFELLYLHVHNDQVLTENLFKEFIPDVKGLFHKLQTIKFEDVCRDYLNNVNKNLMSKREVFSIRCTRLYAGGCLLEPLTESQFFWVDANNKSQRLTFQCKSALPKPSESCIMHVKFSNITDIKTEHQFEKEFQILLKGKELKKIIKQIKNDEILCLKVHSNSTDKEICDFKNNLETVIQIKKTKKLSLSCDEIFVDRNCGELITKNKKENTRQSQVKNVLNNRKEQGINRIIPQALTLLNKIESEINTEKQLPLYKETGNENNENNPKRNGSISNEIHEKNDTIVAIEKSLSYNSSINIESSNREKKMLPAIVPESEELTPNSFVESLNTNIEIKSSPTLDLFENHFNNTESGSTNNYKSSHKLFHRSDSFFSIVNENSSFKQKKKSEINKNAKFMNLNVPKTNELIQYKSKVKRNLFEDRTNYSPQKKFGFSSSQSDNYFRGGSLEKKMKPTLPKLKNEVENTKPKLGKEKNFKNKNTIDINIQKPSLLDPNGYAYRQWLKPATSERSKFWLNKLKNLEKKKQNSDKIFEFTDESDCEINIKSNKNNKNNRKITKNMNAKKKRKDIKKSEKTLKKKNIVPQKKFQDPMINVKNILLQTDFSKDKQQELKEFKENIEVSRATTTPKNLMKVSNNSENVTSEEVKNTNKNFEEKFSTSKENIFDFPERFVKKNSLLKINRNESDLNFTENEFYLSSDISEKGFELDHNNIEWQKNRFSESPLKSLEFDILKNSNRENLEKDSIKFDSDLDFESSEGNFFLNVFENNNANEEKAENLSFQKENNNKKMKTNESFFVVKSQLDKIEEKTKKETNEIFKLFNTVANRFVNKLSKKYYHDVISFIRNTTDATYALSQFDFDNIKESIKKFYLYFNEKCSVSNYLDTIHTQISIIQKAEENFFNNNEKPLWIGIENINNELKSMIQNEIEQLIGEEIATIKNRLIQYAAALNLDFYED